MASNRMVRALCAESAVYREVAVDSSATGQAIAIMGLAVLMNAVATSISLSAVNMGGRSTGVALTWVLCWVVGCLAIYLPGARALGGREIVTAAFRVMAFAILPAVAGLLAVALLVSLALWIPAWVLVALPVLVFVIGWALKALVTGVNEMFNLGLGRTLVLSVAGGVGMAMVACIALIVLI
jgi:hypothetical protein